MKLVPIQQVAGRLRSGEALAFGVRDAQGKLLLARGQMVPNDQMREALLNRGVFVDLDELRDASGRGSDGGAGSEDFFARWGALPDAAVGAAARAAGDAVPAAAA